MPDSASSYPACDGDALQDGINDVLTRSFETVTLLYLSLSDSSFTVFGGSGTNLAGVTWTCYCTLPASQYLSASIWESAAQNDGVNTNGESTTNFRIDAFYVSEQLDRLRDLQSPGNAADLVLNFLTYEARRDNLQWWSDGTAPTVIQYWRQETEQSGCADQSKCYPWEIDGEDAGCPCASDELLAVALNTADFCAPAVSLTRGDVCTCAVVDYTQDSFAPSGFTGSVNSPDGCGFVEEIMTQPYTFSNMLEVAGNYMCGGQINSNKHNNFDNTDCPSSR
jgi:hypothetical protein